MRRLGLLGSVLFPVLVFTFACGPSKAPERAGPEGKLAVAPFHQPRQEWELPQPDGAAPERELPDKAQEMLTAKLMESLKERGRDGLIGPKRVQGCREIVLQKGAVSTDGGRAYWAEVARCASADSILVPQLLRWQQRKGGRWGADTPAGVTMRFIWLESREKRIVDVFIFDREQKALTENLLQIGRFVRRGGRWVRAEELADEGIRAALRDMGL